MAVFPLKHFKDAKACWRTIKFEEDGRVEENALNHHNNVNVKMTLFTTLWIVLCSEEIWVKDHRKRRLFLLQHKTEKSLSNSSSVQNQFPRIMNDSRSKWSLNLLPKRAGSQSLWTCDREARMAFGKQHAWTISFGVQMIDEMIYT